MSRPLIFLVSLVAAVANVGLAIGPAYAAEPEACIAAPGDLRAALVRADDRAARKALRKIDIGERLCEAGNEREAGKKFAEAGKILGVEKTELADRR